MTLLRRCGLAAIAVGALTGLIPAPAWACGGLFCQNAPIDQTGEKILFSSNGTQVTAYVQIAYQGEAKDFSWVVPVPSHPTLEAGSNSLFTALMQVTRPRFQLTYAQARDAKCLPPGSPCDPPPAPASMHTDLVVETDRVGPYDTAILSADEPGAVVAWLKANHYVLPGKLEPLLTPYVAGNYDFVALKLSKDSTVGDITPIVMTYAATKPGIPIRLTGVAATPDMDVYVWVLGAGRAGPENYRHAIINEARINWSNGGENYREVVSEAMDEAGGQAFVTDFAGPATALPASAFATDRLDTGSLKTIKDPFAFGQAVINRGFFRTSYGTDTAALLNFLKHYVPKPASLAEWPDGSFYGNLGVFGWSPLPDDPPFDTAPAIAALREAAIAPYDRIRSLLAEGRYLTALYTTMSPEEMTQDPMFVFNRGMGDVSNLHVAAAVPFCSQAALDHPFVPNGPSWAERVEITLADGRHLDQAYTRTCSGEDAALQKGSEPAAWRIEQFLAQGEPAVITDHAPSPLPDPSGEPTQAPATAAPSPAVAPPVFGCRGCAASNRPPAPSENGGEGLAYAVVMLGFLGYRRRLGRR